MDVTIGIAKSGREVKLDVEQSPEAIEAVVAEGLAGTHLTLVDDRGRRVMVRSSEIAYVEIGPADSRPVGFSAGA